MDFSIKLVFLLILFEPTLQQSCDVFFIIDGSNVITDNARSGDRLQQWYSIRTIVADVLQNLTNFNVAISIYADKVWQVATYPTPGPQASLIMKSLDFLGGQFAVGAAIKWTRENVITPNKQTNANIACFLLATYPPFGNDLIVWNTEKNLLRGICGKLIVLAIGRIDLENVYKSIATSSDSFLRIDFTNLSENKAIGSFMLNQILSACPSRPTSATFSTITTTTLRPAQ
ncbi:hypothetical protein HELRODRAFT_194163, partial [Helobdella robusta]|uniref:VWFA domain-containing protein n=1 Tax=Helobdella robusta TaxID=6412 RepID=T1FVR7_HELRO